MTTSIHGYISIEYEGFGSLGLLDVDMQLQLLAEPILLQSKR